MNRSVSKPSTKQQKKSHKVPKRAIATTKRVKKVVKSTKKSINASLTQISPIFQNKRFFSAIGEGSDPAFSAQSKPQQSQTEKEQDDLLQQIDSVVKSYPVVLFMKGTPAQPQCGFSRRVVQILSQLEVSYEACNVLDSVELREGIKVYANWPTIPQLFVNGEFVGGCDIVTQMFQQGELQDILPKNEKKTPAAAATTEAKDNAV